MECLRRRRNAVYKGREEGLRTCVCGGGTVCGARMLMLGVCVCCDAVATVLSLTTPSSYVQFDDGNYWGHVTDDWDRIGEYTHQ